MPYPHQYRPVACPFCSPFPPSLHTSNIQVAVKLYSLGQSKTCIQKHEL